MTLLPPNRTSAELAFDRASDRLLDIPVPNASLWTPATCPAEFLPWLAWALSVDSWDMSDSLEDQRAQVAASIAIHRLKGTRGAVRRALATLNIRVDIREWFETDEAPHTFRVEAFAPKLFKDGAAINQRLLRRIEQAVYDVAPVRSHFTVAVGERLDAQCDMRSGIRFRATRCSTLRMAVSTRKMTARGYVRSGTRLAMRRSSTLRFEEAS